MSNKQNDLIIDDLIDASVDFKFTVDKFSKQLDQKPEEIVRLLITKIGLDIRECLNYKDIVNIYEFENDRRKEKELDDMYQFYKEKGKI